MREVVIIDGVRSPIGKFGGGLSKVRPDDLLAEVYKGLMERTGVNPALIDDVYAGCGNQGGEDNRDVARMSTLLAGFPIEVSGVTVNRNCASALEAVFSGHSQRRADFANRIISASALRIPDTLTKKP